MAADLNLDAVLRALRAPGLMCAGGDRTIFVGVDLGKLECHSAIVVLERFEEIPTDFAEVLRGTPAKRRYVVRFVERLALGMPYTEVVMRVKTVVAQVSGILGTCAVVVDGSGVGVSVVEHMREVEMGCRVYPITISSGQQATGRSVPRVELLTKLKMMVERGELELAAGCRHGEQLKRELVHLQLEGGGRGELDDLALALALACWKARVR